MITWVTVWVLTVTNVEMQLSSFHPHTYQLTYATQEICEKQRKNHKRNSRTRCDFQQFPVYKGGK